MVSEQLKKAREDFFKQQEEADIKYGSMKQLKAKADALRFGIVND